MNRDQAEKVREWRVTDGCSWRVVAKRASEEWPDIGVRSGNQPDGMYLCEDAMAILGENAEDGW